MSSSVRIAISEGLPVTGAGLHWVHAATGMAATGGGGGGGVSEDRQRQRWLRILHERRRREAPAVLDALLLDPAVRALLLVLDRSAEAALLSECGATGAWSLLEPAGTGVCADLWIGVEGAWKFGWVEAIAGESAAATAARLQAAAATLAQALEAPVQPLAVHFASGPDPHAREWEHQLATLRARQKLKVAEIYSPLLFQSGRLQAAAFLQAVRVALGSAATPLLYVPRLPGAEFAAAFAGPWCGPFRAGAEAPAARLAPQADAATAAATIAILLAWANARPGPQ